MHPIRIDVILEDIPKIRHAIPVIYHKKTVLLGLSNANDFRNNKWCFVAGHIKSSENPYQAAIREAREEANLIIKCGDISFTDGPNIFIKAEAQSIKALKHNGEFKAMGFFDRKGMKSLKLCDNVLSVLDKMGLR